MVRALSLVTVLFQKLSYVIMGTSGTHKKLCKVKLEGEKKLKNSDRMTPNTYVRDKSQ